MDTGMLRGKGREAERGRKQQGEGVILLFCTWSHGGPERPLQASTMSDHISVAASSFLSLHTHTLIQPCKSNVCAQTLKNAFMRCFP